jgi:hypothetical protein
MSVVNSSESQPVAFGGRESRAWRAASAIVAAALLSFVIDGCTPSSQSVQSQAPVVSEMTGSAAPSQKQQSAPPQLDINTVGTPPDASASISLAAPFTGCWNGTIEGGGSLVPIGFLSSLVTLPPTSYRFCYLPDPNGRSARMELLDMVSDNIRPTVTEFANQVVWSDDQSAAYLRNHIGTIGPVWLPYTHTREDVYADEIVTVKNPNLLIMQGVELIKVSGSDYLRASFHADFHRDLGHNPQP